MAVVPQGPQEVDVQESEHLFGYDAIENIRDVRVVQDLDHLLQMTQTGVFHLRVLLREQLQQQLYIGKHSSLVHELYDLEAAFDEFLVTRLFQDALE